MKFSEIERLFSQKVAEYLAKGFTIDVQSARSYGGEIGKVDLRNDDRIIRVAVRSKLSLLSDDELSDFYPERVLIRVSEMRYTRKEETEYDRTEGYPDSDFSVLEEQEWVCVSKTWFVTKEEAVGFIDKKKNRIYAQYDPWLVNQRFIPLRCDDLLVKIARRHRGMKSVTYEDVVGYVVQIPYRDWEGNHEVGHYIRVKSHGKRKEIKIL